MRPCRRGRTAAIIAAAGIAATPLTGCDRTEVPSWQGYIEGEFVNVASPFAGRLDRLSVQRGQTVEANAPLFALEAIDEEAARQQAAGALKSAEARLADLQTGKRPAEIGVNEAQLAQARANAARSAAQLTRDEAQYRIGGIPQSQLEQSRATASADASRVRELIGDVAVARLPGRDAQRDAQAAEIESARAALAQAEWKLSRKTLTAPHAGLIYDTLFRPGEWVPAGSPVVRMLPPGNVKVRYFVPEAAVGAIRTGQRVSIRCDGCPQPVPATITYVSSQAEYTPPVIYSNETRRKLVFLVEAHPAPEDAARLHPGQPVEVTAQ